MTLLTNLKKRRHSQKMLRTEQLRQKNDALRKAGKEPLKGWNTMINTGLGGLNKVTGPSKGSIDLTGKTNGTYNIYSEEQKQLGAKLSQRTNHPEK